MYVNSKIQRRKMRRLSLRRIACGISNRCQTPTMLPVSLARSSFDHRATPSSALKQSSKVLLCLFVACSVSILRLVVLWKDWKHVLHLMVRAAAFYVEPRSATPFSAGLSEFAEAYRFQLTLCLALATLCSVALTLLLCSVRVSVLPRFSAAVSRTLLRYPWC